MVFRRGKKRKLMEYLEQEKGSYPEVFEKSPDTLLFIIDLKGVIITIRGGESSVYSEEIKQQIIGEKYKRFVHKEDVEKVEGYFENVYSGVSQYANYRVLGIRGETYHVEVTLVPIRLEDDEIVGLYGLSHNVTNKVELEMNLKKSKEKLQSLLYYSHEIITKLDSEGTITFQSSSVETALGYKPEEITGLAFTTLVHPDDHSILTRKFTEAIARPNTPLSVEVRLKHLNGEWRTIDFIATNLLDNPSIQGIICNGQDVTEMKKKQNEIYYMANHDYLTGLPNRRSFEERLDFEIRLANVDERKFAVLFLDLDGFKYFNDSLGHEIGDLLLIEIARKLKVTLSKTIEFIARVDGNKFAILTKKVEDISSVERIAGKVLDIFKVAFEVKEFTLYVSTTMGISVYPESGVDTNSLMKHAGIALHLAEQKGSNHYKIYSESANVSTFKEFSLRNDLRHAVEEEQFLIYYQPIYHTGTNRIESVEALIRWDHPEWGIIPPNEFIPYAEQSGLIIQLGEWVLKTVCSKLRTWQNAGYEVKGSVNLSMVQFLQTNLLEVIKKSLEENALDAKWLTLEITESAVVEQEVNVLEKVEKIRELGITISLDDFGTGYASFNKIKELKPDILKLDKSLIDGVLTDPESIEITTAVIRLAHRLSIRVVAEGVETQEQHDFLATLDCDWVQGYVMSRPVPEEDILRLLKGKWEIEEETEIKEERRKYFRIKFDYPLEAWMTLSELNGRKVELGNTKVLVEDFGPGGLCFLSNIKLPSLAGVVLKFKTTILNEELTLYGAIIHDSEQGNLYRYGVEFILDEPKREDLIKYLNQFQVQLNRNPILEGHPFVTENVHKYFNNR
ncbi:EAL domain-containing protein [Sporosarcina sp. CAU 1771]